MTRQLFGTDGVRGRANSHPMTADIAMRLGQAVGAHFTNGDHRHRVVIGKDTRRSGYMIENALASGFLSVGMDVHFLGPVPTPAVGMLTRSLRADLGVMISASHNPFEDNGIKLFGPNGFKLKDDQEAEIEKLMDTEDTLPRPVGEDIGVVSNYFEGTQKYISYLQETIDTDFDGMNVALDCANGATSSIAAHLFADLEAEIYTIGNNPNGYNINDGVGSTNPEKLQALVVEKKADIGLAFDGDGDRLIAINENGEIVDE